MPLAQRISAASTPSFLVASAMSAIDRHLPQMGITCCLAVLCDATGPLTHASLGRSAVISRRVFPRNIFWDASILGSHGFAVIRRPSDAQHTFLRRSPPHVGGP